jgi:hypothetical protein
MFGLTQTEEQKMTFAQMSLGPFSVATTSNGGLPPEYYAERLVAKLIYISETAPPEIKLQALAYQEAMRAAVLDVLRTAILSNHTTVIYQLRKAGMNEAAQLIYELNRR